LTLVIAAAVYVVALLGGVVEEVIEAEEIVVLDTAISDFLAPVREVPLVPFFLWITRFGNTETLVAVTLVSTGFLWADRRPAYILPLWIAVLGSQATTWSGKFGFARPRPEFVTSETALSPAFPSAHATGAAAVYGFVAYAIIRDALSARQRFEVAYWSMVLIALVSFSRIFLGVHFASDVAAGLLVGSFWLHAGGVSAPARHPRLRPPARRRPRPDRIRCGRCGLRSGRRDRCSPASTDGRGTRASRRVPRPRR
jgi:undecaprenyl-diphosphatase